MLGTIGPSEPQGNLPKQPKIAKNSLPGSSWVLLAPWLLLASKQKGNSHMPLSQLSLGLSMARVVWF